MLAKCHFISSIECWLINQKFKVVTFLRYSFSTRVGGKKFIFFKSDENLQNDYSATAGKRRLRAHNVVSYLCIESAPLHFWIRSIDCNMTGVRFPFPLSVYLSLSLVRMQLHSYRLRLPLNLQCRVMMIVIFGIGSRHWWRRRRHRRVDLFPEILLRFTYWVDADHFQTDFVNAIFIVLHLANDKNWQAKNSINTMERHDINFTRWIRLMNDIVNRLIIFFILYHTIFSFYFYWKKNHVSNI